MKRPKLALVALGAIIAVLSMAGCSASTPAKSGTVAPTSSKDPGPAENLTVASGFLLNAQNAGLYVADSDGIYAKYGLNVKITPGGPNAPAPEVSLDSGQAQVAIESNTSRMLAYLAKQDDIVMIGEQFQKTPNGLLSLAKHPIRKPGDLKGASILAGAANRSSIDALMKINGVKDYSFVPAGADVGPLMSGQGDALLAFADNQPLTLEQQFNLKPNKGYYFTPFSDLGYYLMSNVLIVKKDYLKSHRDTVIRFLAATVEGWEKQIKNPKVGANLAVTKYGATLGLDPAQQLALAKADIPYMTSSLTKQHGLLYIDSKYVQNKVYPSLEAGGVTGMPTASSVIDMSPLSAAYKLIGKN